MSDQSHGTPRSLKRRAASATAWMVAFVASLTFGVILLIDTDWIPGAIIISASLVGLAVTVPAIGRLCREAPAAPRIPQKPAS